MAKIGGGDSIVRNYRLILKDDEGKLVRAWEFESINGREFQVKVAELMEQGLIPKGPENVKKYIDVQNF